jgi:hypothetical protein
MMVKLLAKIGRWLRSIGRTADALVDALHPEGHVEAILFYARGPKKGQVYKRYRGRNIVTSWQSGDTSPPTGGRDLMRRILIPPGETGSLAGATDCYVKQVSLGSGTTAETASDSDLDTPIAGSKKDIEDVTLDGSNPYVTFIVNYDESEVNQTIAEAGLWSGSTREDFIARKTFGAFTKTNEFTLQIRWQIRF